MIDPSYSEIIKYEMKTIYEIAEEILDKAERDADMIALLSLWLSIHNRDDGDVATAFVKIEDGVEVHGYVYDYESRVLAHVAYKHGAYIPYKEPARDVEQKLFNIVSALRWRAELLKRVLEKLCNNN